MLHIANVMVSCFINQIVKLINYIKMEASEKARQILEKINNGKITKALWENCSDYAKKDLKRKALIVLDEIEIALTEYGKESMELQNMDSEFRYWNSVRNAVLSF